MRIPNGRTMPRAEQRAFEARSQRAEARAAGCGRCRARRAARRSAASGRDAAAVALLDGPERRVEQRADDASRDDLEAGGRGLGGQLAARVATLVPEEAVVVVVGAGAGRDDDRGDARRGGARGTARAARVVVGDVFEQVRGDDRVDASVAQRQVADVGEQQRRSGTFACALRSPAATRSTPTSVALRVGAPAGPRAGSRSSSRRRPRRRRGYAIGTASEERPPRPDVDEVVAAGLLVQRLELVGPVDVRRPAARRIRQ